ncbi:MAG TPA: hypothetical protein VMD53_00470 [Rhizomicrobium sp.]|nr:hypothetical protein [Rhizomicrobium sp.]
MNMPLPREFRLSSKDGLGVRCDEDGAFVGDVALLERIGNEWAPRGGEELSAALSKTYGLPVDVSAKEKGLATVARALNKGDVARAQLATLFAHFPDPPSLAKRARSQDEIIKLALALDWASLLKINTLHYPAKTPGGKGGQFAPKDANTNQDAQSDSDLPDAPNNSSDIPREGRRAARGAVGAATESAEESAERQAARSATTAATETAEQTAERQASRAAVRTAVEEAAVSAESAGVRLAARRLFREAALDALKSVGKKLVLSEIPIVGQLADAATVFDVIRFAKQFFELRKAVIAATRFVNEGAHTLADLRVSQEFQSFQNYPAFVKADAVANDDLKKRLVRWRRHGIPSHH